MRRSPHVGKALPFITISQNTTTTLTKILSNTELTAKPLATLSWKQLPPSRVLNVRTPEAHHVIEHTTRTKADAPTLAQMEVLSRKRRMPEIVAYALSWIPRLTAASIFGSGAWTIKEQIASRNYRSRLTRVKTMVCAMMRTNAPIAHRTRR
ncbi:uncharacterized protein PG986_008483 [Apiospora aurea]|uniref:HAT C-terminal dimerisation domain-containing protein n=1 Tax=Apiospora aurea TaxID=335848 RepID=A0ABR1QH01_9PEZI